MSSQDDEYRWAGVEDPKIVLTTSRDPSSRLKMFSKVVIANLNFLNHLTNRISVTFYVA